jgi:hypothetical protein
VTGKSQSQSGNLPVAALKFKAHALNSKSAYFCQSFALKGQYIPARRIAAGSIAQEINAL